MSKSLWTLDRITLQGRHRPRLDDVSLQIPAGITAVVGYSGAGKTSLLNLLVGFEMPDRGTIQIPWETDTGRRLPLYWVPHTDGLWPHLTVEEHLKTVASFPDGSADRHETGSTQRQHPDESLPSPTVAEHGCRPPVARRSLEILEAFDLDHKASESPERLSQGERSRLAVARALASEAAAIVMDEPLVHVDPARLGKYWQIVRRHCEMTDTSLVIATHSPEVVLREAQFVICLTEGRVQYMGEIDELYYRPATSKLAEFLGPANWMAADEAESWLRIPQDGTRCYRPEQITIATDTNSPLVVQSSRFAGSVEEVDLWNEQTGQQRTFFHRPSRQFLQKHDRVVLKICSFLLMCCLLLGCNSDGDNAPEIPVRSISHWSMPPAENRIPAPRSLHAAFNGEVYALDRAGRVLVFTPDGELKRHWMMPEHEIGKPEGLCLLKDGRLVVADTHYHRIVFFSNTGEVLDMIGSLGEEPGQFIYPVAVVQDDSENIYVCEYGSNDRIQKFTADGDFLLEFGSFGTEAGQFQRPSGIVWYEGKVYVADAFNNRIQVFSDSGKLLQILNAGDPAAALNYPYDITISTAGELYVIEYGAGRISKFDLSGRLLGRFGSTGWEKGQFSTPWGLTIGGRSHLYVADTGNRRIVELEL